MTLRNATAADLPRLANLAEQFYSASRFLKRFDLERFCTVWRTLLEGGSGVVFLLEDEGAIAGTLGGMLYPDLYSGDLIATEFFWFVDPANRGGGMQLYRAFEAWACANHATEIRMVHLHDSMPERLSVLYRRLGYVAAETHYTKDLKS